MPRFASETSVPVERSRAEIEETLRRYGAIEFHSGWKAEAAMIGFRLKDLYIRFVLPFPSRSDRRFTHKTRHGYDTKVSDLQAAKAYDQELRSRWRALLLVIKAKLEAVEIGISSIEKEFLAFIQMSDGTLVGDWIIDQALPSIRSGAMPPLALPPGRSDVIDAEFEAKPKT